MSCSRVQYRAYRGIRTRDLAIKSPALYQQFFTELMVILIFFLPACGDLTINVTETHSFTLPCYRNYQECTYNITGDGTDIELFFRDFSIEDHSRCLNDHVEVCYSC